MSELDDESRAIVAAYWWQRAEGEMTSFIGFQHVLDDLRHEGSPPAVVALAERAVHDERRHAMWCRDWAMHFGHPGGEVAPRTTKPVGLPNASDDENRLLRITLCCLTETVGCVILRHARPRVVDPELRALYRRHMADELQHSRVGWGHLAALDAPRRAVVRAWMPTLLRALPEACSSGTELDRDDLVPWGYFTPALLEAARDEAIGGLILPGLHHLGLGRAA